MASLKETVKIRPEFVSYKMGLLRKNQESDISYTLCPAVFFNIFLIFPLWQEEFAILDKLYKFIPPKSKDDKVHKCYFVLL